MRDPLVIFGDEVTQTLPLLREFLEENGADPRALQTRLDETQFRAPSFCKDVKNEHDVRILFLKELRPLLSGAAMLAGGFSVMSKEQQQVLLLVDGCHCSYDEAAQTCGRPVGTIKSRLHRARSFLNAE